MRYSLPNDVKWIALLSIFGRLKFQTSAQRSVIQSGSFHGFPQSPQENYGIIT
jgi:hypothetical protein